MWRIIACVCFRALRRDAAFHLASVVRSRSLGFRPSTAAAQRVPTTAPALPPSSDGLARPPIDALRVLLSYLSSRPPSACLVFCSWPFRAAGSRAPVDHRLSHLARCPFSRGQTSSMSATHPCGAHGISRYSPRLHHLFLRGPSFRGGLPRPTSTPAPPGRRLSLAVSSLPFFSRIAPPAALVVRWFVFPSLSLRTSRTVKTTPILRLPPRTAPLCRRCLPCC